MSKREVCPLFTDLFIDGMGINIVCLKKYLCYNLSTSKKQKFCYG